MKHILPLFFFFAFVAALPSCSNKEIAVTSVQLVEDSLHLAVGEVYQLEVLVLPLEAQRYNIKYWKSSDEKVARVDSKGNITAVYSGTCVISVTCNKVKASCVVTVDVMNYDINLPNGVAYFYGDAYHNNTYNTTLRLYDNGLTLTPDGAIDGIGVFFNLDVLGTATDTVPIGNFVAAADTAVALTFLPGQLVERNGNTYAAGTFLAQYTTNGLAVVFVKDGSCTIEQKDNDYVVKANFVGERDEEITLTFEAPLIIVDKTENAPQPEEVIFNLEVANVSGCGQKYDAPLNVFQLTVGNGTESLVLEMFAPISANELPVGRYSLGTTPQAFTLIPADDILTTGCRIINGNDTIAITSGTLQVSKNEQHTTYSLRLRDANGRVIKG